MSGHEHRPRPMPFGLGLPERRDCQGEGEDDGPGCDQRKPRRFRARHAGFLRDHFTRVYDVRSIVKRRRLSHDERAVRLHAVSDYQPTDEELLVRLGRDPDAICLVYDRHVVQLVRYLEGAGASREVAWDAVQETFARLLERGPRVRAGEDGSAWPWLAVSARNLLRDWQRRGRVDDHARRRIGIDVIAASEEELDRALARLESKTHSGELAHALAALPTDQRTAVTGRVLHGLDYDELAAAGHTSEQTIRRRLSRGLRSMRTLLEGGN